MPALAEASDDPVATAEDGAGLEAAVIDRVGAAQPASSSSIVLRDDFVAPATTSRCVTSEPHGVGAEQRGQKTADSEMSVEQVGQTAA